ncbi:MAG: hypothetical protein U0736_10755 [Gemmataceae bacterium]
MRSIGLSSVARLSLTAALLFGSNACLTSPASAQYPRIAPDARGYQTTMQLMQQRAASSPSLPRSYARSASPSLPQSYTVTPAAPAYQAVQVTVAAPQGRTQVARGTPATQPGVPYSIAIRGPDGEVRRYPVEGGPSSVVVRQYTVSPGQAITVYVQPPAPATPSK